MYSAVVKIYSMVLTRIWRLSGHWLRNITVKYWTSELGPAWNFLNLTSHRGNTSRVWGIPGSHFGLESTLSCSFCLNRHHQSSKDKQSVPWKLNLSPLMRWLEAKETNISYNNIGDVNAVLLVDARSERKELNLFQWSGQSCMVFIF